MGRKGWAVDELRSVRKTMGRVSTDLLEGSRELVLNVSHDVVHLTADFEFIYGRAENRAQGNMRTVRHPPTNRASSRRGAAAARSSTQRYNAAIQGLLKGL
jgi:hypothetical protein